MLYNENMLIGHKSPFGSHHIRQAFDLSVHDLRVWRASLPPYSNQTRRRGVDSGFTYGDFLAFAIYRVLIKRFGVRPDALVEVSAAIASYCNETMWDVLRVQYLIIDFEVASGKAVRCEFERTIDVPPADDHGQVAVLILPVEPCLSHVERYLDAAGFRPSAASQLNLNYPASMERRHG